MAIITDFIAQYQTFIVLGILLMVFVAFFVEKVAPDVIALSSVALLLILGIINTEEFLLVFSNSAPITIAMMFVISAALERTGCLKIIGVGISKIAGQSYTRTMLVMMLSVMVISAFMNNTPVVIVMTPVIISLARTLGISPSKMLIPFSFAAIFGGATTLVGSSTNILVSGIASQSTVQAIEPIGMFELTIPGLIFAAVGIVYMLIAGRYLLPDRQSLSQVIADQPKNQYLAELLIPHKSSYIGKRLVKTGISNKNTRIIDVIRDEKSLRGSLGDVRLQSGDLVMVETGAGEILNLKEDGQIKFRRLGKDLEPVSASKKIIMEATVGRNSILIGSNIRDLKLRRKYGVYIVAIHRDDENIEKDFEQINLKFGDTLLIEGSEENIGRLIQEVGIVDLSHLDEKAVKKSKAPIAIATILGVMVMSAIGTMPIAGLSVIGAAIVLLTKCIDPKEAYKSIEWNILFLIFGMLGLSVGMQKTGAGEFIVEHIVTLVQNFGPVAILAMIYITTSILTEMVSNNAVATIITPIVIGLSYQLGFDPKPFLITVMFAGSASFATPIGYQTNTFVYGAGGYKFKDFLKVGVPLNIIFAILATIIIPIFFPFWG